MAASDLFMRLNRAGLVCASEGHFSNLPTASSRQHLAEGTGHDRGKKGGDDELAGAVQVALAVQALSFPTQPRPYLGFFGWVMGDGMSCLAAWMEYLWKFGPLAGRPGGLEAWRGDDVPTATQHGYPRRGRVST